MKANIGISQRLLHVILLQAFLISVIALLGVYAARYVIGDVLIQRALDDEASHYWSLFTHDGDAPRPDTYNLTGYLQGSDSIPDIYSELGVGLHKVNVQGSDIFIVHVSEKESRKLFLEFNGEQVSELALFFGVFPLTGFLIIIYLSGWLTYRFLSQAVSPVVKLARSLEDLDPKSEEFSEKLKKSLPDDVNQEVKVLSSALSDLSDRISAFVVRERNFTRDASHELRSPITVIKIASDLLLGDEKLTEFQKNTIEKIKSNATDMEELIETLLVLARESNNELSYEKVCVNDVCREEIERTSVLFPDKPVKASFECRNELMVSSSDKVLSVMIGNLIRNAFSYTDKGEVVVKVEGSELMIEDSGVGMKEDELEKMFEPFNRGRNKQRGGYGVGLTIVKMLSDRFNWDIKIHSEIGKGTCVTVNFPDGKLI